ncbi:hypothetical protein D9758_013397 [Tetrapyrgos nigripes]|uniref:Uncharacterized protein n=1 Tax=Tetrapyrgos nigripes TaxID=182062 RepID=A0A8H5CK01_9AGAR|nr:hypothetical protein D9758_013397 [Tetrapyrgos nigripes]
MCVSIGNSPGGGIGVHWGSPFNVSRLLSASTSSSSTSSIVMLPLLSKTSKDPGASKPFTRTIPLQFATDGTMCPLAMRMTFVDVFHPPIFPFRLLYTSTSIHAAIAPSSTSFNWHGEWFTCTASDALHCMHINDIILGYTMVTTARRIRSLGHTVAVQSVGPSPFPELKLAKMSSMSSLPTALILIALDLPNSLCTKALQSPSVFVILDDDVHSISLPCQFFPHLKHSPDPGLSVPGNIGTSSTPCVVLGRWAYASTLMRNVAFCVSFRRLVNGFFVNGSCGGGVVICALASARANGLLGVSGVGACAPTSLIASVNSFQFFALAGTFSLKKLGRLSCIETMSDADSAMPAAFAVSRRRRAKRWKSRGFSFSSVPPANFGIVVVIA